VRPSHSETFPSLPASGPVPRGMFLFGALGASLAVVAWAITVLVVHHWI